MTRNNPSADTPTRTTSHETAPGFEKRGGGYGSSSTPVSQLAPPPSGPAPGARPRSSAPRANTESTPTSGSNRPESSR